MPQGELSWARRPAARLPIDRRVVVVALRVVTLLLRFALTFYLVTMLGRDATGQFGLIVAVAAIVPALVGLGLNYFLSRDIVGLPLAAAAPLIRDRLNLTVIAMVAPMPLLALVLPRLVGATDGPTRGLAVLVIAMEVLALDTYQVLIGLNRITLANLVVALRTGLWVLPCVLLGVLMPATRTLAVVLLWWLAGHGAALVLLLRRLWQGPARDAVRTTGASGWVRATLPHAGLIYLSDLGLAGAVFIDRFILHAAVSLADLGTYTFCWTFANAIQTVVIAAVAAPAMPLLVGRAADGIDAAWRRILMRELGIAAFATLAMAVPLAGVLGLVHALFPARVPWAPGLIAALMVMTGMRAVAEVLNAGMTAARRIRAYALLNLAHLGIVAGLGLALVPRIGLLGAPVAGIAGAMVVGLWRWGLLWRVGRPAGAAA